MQSLRRTSVGRYTLAQSIPLDELRSASPERVEQALLSPEELFVDLPEVALPPFFARLFGNGETILCGKVRSSLPTGLTEGSLFRTHAPDGRFLVGQVAKMDENLYISAKIFF